jgi:hypothetical protein
MVKASSSACVGCSCVPSPALMTPALIQPRVASVNGAPDAGWRITTASAPIACSVWAVSLRLSPLDTLEPLAEKLITSAESRLAAASNEIRVRVDGFWNTSATVTWATPYSSESPP